MKKTLFIIMIGLVIASLKLVFASDWVEKEKSYSLNVPIRVAINHDCPCTSKTDWTRINSETGQPEEESRSVKSNWSSSFANPSSKSQSDNYTCKYNTTGDKRVDGTCQEGACNGESDDGTVDVY